MVALCAQCGAPLTISDLGYEICLNCHWQQMFEYAGTGAGELLIKLRRSSNGLVRDSAGRIWERFPGDGEKWCALCGETVVAGWTQGSPGGPRVHICTDHVEIVPRLVDL